MKQFFLIIPLFLIAKINGQEKDLERAPLLAQSGNYASLGTRSMTPDLPLEKQTVQDLKRRKSTLVTAISIKDVELAKSSFEKDFAWVHKLYLHQRYADNHIPKTTHEEIQERLLFTRRLFEEIDIAIAKEDARQEWLRKFSAPGAFDLQCCAEETDCCNYWPQWANVVGTVLALGLTTLYCAANSPSRLSTSQPCASFPQEPIDRMLEACIESSYDKGIPCHNGTMYMVASCCQNIINAICMKNVTYYNDQVYPKQRLHAWKQEIILIPSLAALQVAFQIGGYYYRRSRRLREPIKQLVTQKKTDFAQIQQDFSKLQIADDANFQETL